MEITGERLRQEYRIEIDSASRQELTRHGTPDFPVMVYRTVLRENVLGYVNWHWHKELQFCVVIKGTVEFFVNERRCTLREGDGIFINAGYLHMARAAADPDSAYYCVDADAKLLCGFAGSILEKKYVTPFLEDDSLEDMVLLASEKEQEKVLQTIRAISEEFAGQRSGRELRITALLMEAWDGILQLHGRTLSAEDAGRSKVSSRGRRKEPKAPDMKEDTRESGEARKAPARVSGVRAVRSGHARYALVRSIMTYIGQHYAEKITIDQIAAEVSFSGSECCRRFREVTRQTIFEYLQNIRITQATEMLVNTSAPISRIAYENGFCSTSYFIEVFRKRTGMTPLQYRKK